MPPQTIYRLRVSLDYTDPPVHRTIDVPHWFNFEYLHIAIQFAMGWENSHLFEFRVFKNKTNKTGIRVGIDNGEGDLHDGVPFYALDSLQLRDVLLTRHVRMKYRYDFGDSWDHTITIDSIGPAEPDVAYPRVVDGANMCPPEDSGGVPGFYNKLAAWKDRESPDYWWAREAFGRHCDPTAFDLKKANRRFSNMIQLSAPTELRIKPEVDFGP